MDLQQRTVKSMNRENVLNYLLLSPQGRTQQELAQHSLLTIASIGNILSELQEKKLIEKSGLALSSGGRKPSIYKLDQSHYRIFSVSIGYGTLTCLLVSLQGNVLAKDLLTFDLEDDPYQVLDHMITTFYSICESQMVSFDQILGVGISAPGPLDEEHGIILNPPNLTGWINVKITQYLHERIPLLIQLEKDANCTMMCEYYYGIARNSMNALYVMVDAGIGSGILVEGEVYKGATQVAGEIGHGTIDLNGLKCNCGNYGCLEVMASGNAIVRKALTEVRKGCPTTIAHIDNNLGLEEVLDAALQGDDLCLSLLQDSSRYVGIKLADKINFLNPELVILGGRINDKLEQYTGWVKETALSRIFQETARGVQIKRAKFGDISEGLGAATVVLKEAFKQQ